MSFAGSLEVFSCANGPELYAVSPPEYSSLAVWSGSSWRSGRLPGSPQPGLLKAFDGRLFYPTGNWQTCSQFINTFNYPGACLAVYDDGTGEHLYLGTSIYGAPTGSPATIYVWNGASWDVFATVSGVVPSSITPARVMTMTAYDPDGPGPRPGVLIAGGSFVNINGLGGFLNLAQWDGHSWSSFGGGADGFQPTVTLVYPADIGNGPRLYISGLFGTLGGQNLGLIAQWDGDQWRAMTGAPNNGNPLLAMAAFDDGSGPKLWCGGSFASVAGQPAKSLAAWDGAAWYIPPGGGVYRDTSGTAGGVVRALIAHDDGRGPSLFVAGEFQRVGVNGAVNVLNIARMGPTPCRANCDGSLQANCPTLNVLDFNCFINRFAAQDYRANCDGSTTPPALNVLDFNCFLNAFTAGCP